MTNDHRKHLSFIKRLLKKRKFFKKIAQKNANFAKKGAKKKKKRRF